MLSSSKSIRAEQPQVQQQIKDLKILYTNATSLENKIDELKVTLEYFRPNIAGITETWFKSSSIANINGYSLYRKDRSDGRRGGGVALYIENKIASYEFEDAYFNMSKIEQVWCVLVFGKSKYLIGCIYRPDDMKDMIDLRRTFEVARQHVDLTI